MNAPPITAEQLQELLSQYAPVEPLHEAKRNPLSLAVRLALRNEWRGAFVLPSPWAKK